ncbi:MAG: YbaB/EbfC family nucleoid-associated protein [Christensenellales bacterium]|jgi:DNA-binding YbaB/EbfC family protein
MAKRKSFGGGGGMNMGSMLARAQKMQADMAAAQAEVEQAEVEAAAGGGVVTVRANGAKKILGIKISPEVVDPDDIEMLEDLVMAAVNEALLKADEMMQQKMSGITGGIDLGGMF